MNDMDFATKQDFETVLALPTGTRMEKIIKRKLIAEGIGILEATRDESQKIVIDDGPVDKANEDGPHNTHEIQTVNPIWKQYGFSSMKDSQGMLDRFKKAVV